MLVTSEFARKVWRDAPSDDDVLSTYLASAELACRAYAPALDLTEGETKPGPVTVARRNYFPSPGTVLLPARFSSFQGAGTNAKVDTLQPGVSWAASGMARRTTWTAISAPNDGDIGINVAGVGFLTPNEPWTLEYDLEVSKTTQVTAPATYASQGVYSNVDRNTSNIELLNAGTVYHRWITLTGDITSQQNGLRVVQTMRGKVVGDWMQLSNVVLYPGPKVPFPYFDGNSAPVTSDARTFTHAWTGQEQASTSVETYVPNVFVPTVPENWKLAIVMQARNTWNSAKAAPASGDFDNGGYGLSAFPLDWQVQQLLRPRRAIGAVL